MSPHNVITPITLVTEIDPGAEALATERTGTLTLLSGRNLGALFCLRGDSAIVGRGEDADFVLDEDSVSRHHARLLRTAEGYAIEDLGSTNGTFVAGERIGARTLLVDGMRVRIAGCVLRFAVQDAFAAQAAQRLYEMGIRDALTGLYNRRYIDDRMRNEVAFALRHGTPFAVIVCDIDHFKRINDRWGHQAGDEVLRTVATALQSSVRTEDVLARSGGEEFMVLARGIDPDGARAFAERMRALIEHTLVSWQGEYLGVTLSLGIAHNHAGLPSADGEALIAAADKALYVAKNAGRNRVHLAASPGRYSGVDAQAAVEERALRRKRRHEQATGPTDPQLGAKARRGRA